MFICCFRLLILLLGSEHADVEFGKLQSKDLLQHLRTGAISNASLEVVPGSRSVEVRAVGVTKVCSGVPRMSFCVKLIILLISLFVYREQL